MKDLLFAVFDVKMKMFMAPFLGRNVGAALRQFSDMCGDDRGPFKKHPEDFVLYEIGEFGIEDGSLTPIVPHVVGKALDFVPSASTAMREALKENV